LTVGHDQLQGAWAVLNLVANLVIVAGYLVVPFTVLRYLPLSVSVRWAGSFFFATCGLTHLSMAFGFDDAKWMVVNHVVQAASVVWFVLGFWLLLRAAIRRAEGKRRDE
jgi:hypothetical protein